MSRRALIVSLALALTAAACSGKTPAGRGGAATPSVSDSATRQASAGRASPSASPPTTPAGATPAVPVPVPSGAPIPATGEYLYAQHGSETFCSTAACGTPRALPPTMRATVRYGGADATNHHAVDLDLALAPGRTIRVRSRYSPTSILVDRVEAVFTESGITQSGSIAPTPAIVLLSFPLRKGPPAEQAFTDGNTSGTYTRAVVGEETINAAGQRTRAWRVESTIRTAGEHPSTIGVTMWVEEPTRTFLRLAVTIDVTSEITRYKASFTDTLQSRPR